MSLQPFKRWLSLFLSEAGKDLEAMWTYFVGGMLAAWAFLFSAFMVILFICSPSMWRLAVDLFGPYSIFVGMGIVTTGLLLTVLIVLVDAIKAVFLYRNEIKWERERESRTKTLQEYLVWQVRVGGDTEGRP